MQQVAGRDDRRAWKDDAAAPAVRHLASRRPALSGQSEREQARAQEQEARRSYRQKPIRYEVMVTHSAPANFNARPNLLKFSARTRWSR